MTAPPFNRHHSNTDPTIYLNGTVHTRPVPPTRHRFTSSLSSNSSDTQHSTPSPSPPSHKSIFNSPSVSPSPSPGPSRSGTPNPQVTLPNSDTHTDLRNAIHSLHSDELVGLIQEPATSNELPDEEYGKVAGRIIRSYLRYLGFTWSRAAFSTLMLPTTIVDRLVIFAFAGVSSTILFFLMIWCLIAKTPLFKRIIDKAYADGITLTPPVPRIFNAISVEQVEAAKLVLSQPFPSELGHPHSRRRVFNLDVAKLMLQVSALMYERTNSPVSQALSTLRSAIHNDPHHKPSLPSSSSSSHSHPPSSTTSSPAPTPGLLLKQTIGTSKANLINAELHAHDEEASMSKLAHRLGLRYYTVSELNSPGSAFCALFYDPMGTFIVVGFKGTAPTEFEEWVSDFTYEPRDANGWIRNFGKVHGGFMERMFPRRVKKGTQAPYETIRDAINLVSQSLLKGKPEGIEVQIWFTGHSLGCAMSSLAYARAIHEPKEFGKRTVIRDAYLFAAPILTDVTSVHAFNNRLNHHPHRPRTMWRITNGSDIIATSLPHLGDNQSLATSLSPWNLFSFAHLGTEIRMKTWPERCIVGGSHPNHGSLVRIEGGSGAEEKGRGRDKRGEGGLDVGVEPGWKRWWLLRRVVEHGIESYWDQLCQVGLGTCEWADQ